MPKHITLSSRSAQSTRTGPRRRRRPLFARFASLLAALIVAPVVTAADSVNIDTLPRYQGIADPALSAGEVTLLGMSGATGLGAAGTAGYVLVETLRLNSMTALSVIGGKADDALATALTTNTCKDVRVAVDCEQQNALILLAKIKADLKFYENKYPGFSNPSYVPGNRIEREDWDRYKAIRDALKTFTYTRVNDQTNQKEQVTLQNAEQALADKTKAMSGALLQVEARLAKGKYGLPSLKLDRGFMAEPAEAFNNVVFGIAVMAEQLSAQGPKNQLRAVLTNNSRDLVFLVQVEARDASGDYALRRDTAYPIPIYPDVSQLKPEELKALQTGPYTPPGRSRGRTDLTLPINPRDRLIVRALTMGPVRDRIRFMPVREPLVRLDLNSLSRGFYYLGYEADLPAGLRVSRWYPLDESYKWTFQGGWAPGESANDPKLDACDPKGLVPISNVQLKLANNQMKWVVPASLESASKLEPATAEIEGTTRYQQVGPTALPKDWKEISETGSGKLQMILQAW